MPNSRVGNRIITKKLGRPSSYNKAIADEICERIMMGRPLSKVCLDDDMPPRQSVHNWLIQHSEFLDNYVGACKVRREYRFETLEDVIDQEEDPQRARLKVDVIKWQLSKEEPKKYGDKLDMTSDGKALPAPILQMLIAKNDDSNTERDVIDGETTTPSTQINAPVQKGNIMDDINAL